MSVRVSTIIPAYNAERTIAQAIDSALSQDFKGQEVVVVNDGSTDSTATILKKYGNQIQVVTQRNGGLSAARNAGVRHSTGEYLAFLDADDIWLPEKLKKMVPALERNPLASLAFSEYRFLHNGVECNGTSIGKVRSIQDAQRLLLILPSTWVLTRQTFELTGGFCEEFKGASGFEECWMLVLLREMGEFVCIPECLTLYRVSDSGTYADKYAPGLPRFISMVKQRYGVKGKAVIRTAKDFQCRRLLSKIAYQMNSGDRLGALRTLAGIARLQPRYILGSEFRSRLLLPYNLKRVRDLIALPSRSEQRS